MIAYLDDITAVLVDHREKLGKEVVDDLAQPLGTVGLQGREREEMSEEIRRRIQCNEGHE
jgi:hypothetical protein